MRVRYGKAVKGKSLLGRANTPSYTTSSSANFVLAMKSDTRAFYLGGGINVGYSFNIVNGHKYFMALQIKDMTSTNVDYRRFALWDKTNNVYLNYPTTTIQDTDIFIATYNSSISTEVYHTFQCHYTSSGIEGTPCWWIFIDLTDLGLDSLSATQIYSKYKDNLRLLADGGEVILDGKIGNLPIFSRLPREYQEVEYIESSGNQYIDTGVNASSTLGLSYKINEVSGRFGVLGSDDSKRHHSYDTSALYGYASGGYGSASLGEDTEVRVNWFNDRKLYKNGTKVADLWTGTFDTEMTYILFARSYRSQGTISPYWKGKVYNFKMSYGTKLVRDYIPCYMKYINLIGLYDVSTNKKNLWPRGDVSKYNYSYDYKRYNADKSIFLTKGTYTVSYSSLNGLYIQAFTPDTLTQVSIPTAFSSYFTQGNSTVGLVWENNVGMNCSTDGPITFTLTDDYVITICGRDSSENYNVTNIQIERGSTATTYVKSPMYINKGTGTFTKGNDKNTTVVCNPRTKTYGYNQLVDNGYFDSVTGWDNFNGTYTSIAVSDNILTLTPKDVALAHSYDIAFKRTTNFNGLISDHKYYLYIDLKFSDAGHMFNLWLGNNSRYYGGYGTTVPANEWVSWTEIFTATNTSTSSQKYILGTINCTAGSNYNGQIYQFKKFSLIDLTDWYGPGNEPSTVAEFKETFNKDYYGYCPNPVKLTANMINALPEYGYNQLANINRDTSNGLIALFNSATKKVNISGTSIANSTYLKLSDYFNSVEGDKYYISITGNNVGNGSAFLPTLHPTNLINSPKIITANTTMTNAIIRFNLPNGESIDTDVVVQIINLTDWYGAGNEPSTLAEFKQTFPHKYYPYSKKTPLNKYIINAMASK